MTSSSSDQAAPAFRIADAKVRMRHMFVRDLVLSCLIGVHKFEQRKPQRIRINVDVAIREEGKAQSDQLADVVDYGELTDRIRALVSNGHVNLVETLAERIADLCLAEPRIEVARVRVEKLDIFPDAVSAGVEIERSR